jgi:hypothetical protein
MMGITVTFQGLTEADTGGKHPLAPDEVWFQYLCTTNDATGAHDPNAKPAPRVRPSHACFHGTIWRINDPRAPVPPCDYACRCGIRYVANPTTKSARVMPKAEGDPEVSAADPIRRWLKEHVPAWREVAKAAGERGDLAKATREARHLGIPQPSEIARMVIRAMHRNDDPGGASAMQVGAA